jgi:pimeloyl-ACP methyl ester carboxylesterase
MTKIELSAGPIEYTDTGGDGPALVLVHGLMMDASLWEGSIAGLAADYRCLAPTLPLGAHRQPEIRRDTVRTLRAAGADTQLLVRAAECLPGCG